MTPEEGRKLSEAMRAMRQQEAEALAECKRRFPDYQPPFADTFKKTGRTAEVVGKTIAVVVCIGGLALLCLVFPWLAPVLFLGWLINRAAARVIADGVKKAAATSSAPEWASQNCRNQ